jgi:hypothetical protein
MADGVSARNADESPRLSTQRAHRTQGLRNESRAFPYLRENKVVKWIDFLTGSEETGGGWNPPHG